jgi:adenylate cyclase class 2
MPIEVEKKYRMTEQECVAVAERLRALYAQCFGSELEVNTIYTNNLLEVERAVLRLRRVGNRAILTFKKRFPNVASVKRQLEEETEVSDADATARILDLLGFRQTLVYEKRRQTWKYGGAEITIDELPFGWFIEIEGEEPEIERVEKALGLNGSHAEEATYPQLTRSYGVLVGDVIQAKFKV